MVSSKGALRAALEKFVLNDRFAYWLFQDLASKDISLLRDFGDHKLIFDPSETIGRRILQGGGFAREETTAVLEIAAARGRGAFLEIGANIGTQSVYARLSGHFDRIVAIEPDPRNFAFLRDNVAVNGMNADVEVFQVGLSDKAGTAMLAQSKWNSGTSTLEAHQLESVDSHVEVELEVGDAFLRRIGLESSDIALIWMDVEGHETEALAGLRDTLAPLPLLYFEFTLRGQDDARLKTVDDLVLSAYPHLYIERDRLVPITRDELLELARTTKGHANVLASDRPVPVEGG